MRDLGHEETEEVLKKIEKRISAEYRQAEREIAAKLDDYMKRFAEKDKLKLLGVANGQITEEEYKQWRLGQVMIGQRWSEMRDSLAKDFANTSQIARSIAFDHIPEVYAINHDYGTFQVEKGSLTDTSYTLYDRQSIEQLYKNEDTFIPAPGRTVKRAINEGKQIAWDKKQVQSVMMQGLLQGESIPNIATRLANSVGEGDRKAAIRNARTLTTGIENAGRVASYDRANAMGIKTKKQWLAALDMRTRHWHASLDGVSVENDKPFTNDYGKIMYPGDPEADPANIYNCRCTLIADIEGFENDLSDMSLRRNEKLGDMSYDEWKKGHYDMESDRITKQDEIAETMKRVYGAEYAKYKKEGKNMEGMTKSKNITESEVSKKYGDEYTKDTQIDPIKCKGQGLKNRIDVITESSDESQKVYAAANEILAHRDRTHYEDIAFVFENKTLISKNYDYYDSVNKISKCKPTKKMLNMLSESRPYSVIAVHNHPASYVPSDEDIFAASKRKYKYGVVLCHNGMIYKYQVDEDFNEVNSKIYLAKLNRAVYNNKENEIKNSLEELRKSGVRMEVFS